MSIGQPQFSARHHLLLSIGLEGMDGQTRYLCGIAGTELPSCREKRCSQQTGTDDRRITPEVSRGRPGFSRLLETETFNRFGIAPIRKSQKEARRREADPARFGQGPQ